MGDLSELNLSSFEEEFFRMLYDSVEKDVNGFVTAKASRDLLKSSLLPTVTLKEIWEVVDSSNKGFLTKVELFKALRLIAQAQNKKPVLLQGVLEAGPLPKLRKLTSKNGPPSISLAQVPESEKSEVIEPSSPMESTRQDWYMTQTEKQRYDELFSQMVGENGTIEGSKARDFLLQSGLPTHTLSQIWALADLSINGQLTELEFAIAMHLVYAKLAGQEVPAALPPALMTPSPPLASNESPDGHRAGTHISPSSFGSFNKNELATEGRPALLKSNVTAPPAVSESEKERIKRHHQRSISVDTVQSRMMMTGGGGSGRGAMGVHHNSSQQNLQLGQPGQLSMTSTASIAVSNPMMNGTSAASTTSPQPQTLATLAARTSSAVPLPRTSAPILARRVQLSHSTSSLDTSVLGNQGALTPTGTSSQSSYFVGSPTASAQSIQQPPQSLASTVKPERGQLSPQTERKKMGVAAAAAVSGVSGVSGLTASPAAPSLMRSRSSSGSSLVVEKEPIGKKESGEVGDPPMSVIGEIRQLQAEVQELRKDQKKTMQALLLERQSRLLLQHEMEALKKQMEALLSSTAAKTVDA